MAWKRLAAAIVLFAGGACVSVTASAAVDDELIRTVRWKASLFKNGAPFEVECERGSYLAGFEGRAGAWIDNLRIVCAPWNAARNKLEPPALVEGSQIGWSQGGEPTRSVCPTGLGIAGDYNEHYSRYGSLYVLHTLEFHCVGASDGMRPRWRIFGSTAKINTGWAKPDPHAGCPEGYLATGIYGRSGKFVDKFFGFVCRRRPTVSPVSGTKVIGQAEAKAYDGKSAVGGTSRVGNDIIVAGETSPPPPPPPAQKTATAKADVDIHEKPSGASRRIGIMRKTTTVAVVGSDPEKDWYLLQFNGADGTPNGQGWVTRSWLTVNP